VPKLPPAGNIGGIKEFLDHNQGKFRPASTEERHTLGGSLFEPRFVIGAPK